jgi:drug/metabolite transporter (DMT)-like permease
MTRSLMMQTALLTFLSVTAFAANAVICRWALDHNLIDPVSFTSLRLGSAALSLFAVMTLMHWSNRRRQTTIAQPTSKTNHGSWYAAVVLFLYALTFSYGYVAISTATGALVLAAVVQFTMIGYALRKGDKLHLAEWIGAAVALVGLLYLVYPKLTTPSWWGLVMVMASAFTWALYTLNGQKSLKALSDTAFNFYRTLPMIAVASVLSLLFIGDQVFMTSKGFWLAVISGGVTTGLGYILWYTALPRLSASLASATQLLVPLIAAFGATWLIDEPITLRFMIAAALMLGGLGLVLHGRNEHRKTALKSTAA